MPDAFPSIATFTVLGGPLDRRRLDTDEAVDEILIGSDTDCRFHLDAPGVSPIHARVWMDLDGVTVHDTHSPRGVYVNDNRVAGQAPLRDRDILWLGAPGEESSVMIECRLASATPAPESGTTYSGDANALADLVDVELDRISQPDGPAGATPAEPIGADALAELVPADSFGEPVVEMSPEPPS